MKFIFICLVIANVVLFVLWQGDLTSSNTSPPSPILAQQQNSENLKLISEQEAAKPTVATPEMPPIACLQWGSFPTAELSRAEAQLKALSFGDRQQRQAVEETDKTIVYIPSLGSKAAAERKAAELTSLGVNDFFIIPDNSSNMQWAISLGVFKSEEAAKQLLARLINQGVSSAKLGTRTVVTNKFNLVFKDVTSTEKISLDNLKTEFPDQKLELCDGAGGVT